MESSDTEMGMADCSVGTIVWVRRRNGSWWPGKILGPDELSASHLMSPRSGTPVKLLGREDASVDWYNLEKSKRVKPFRCGEFDDCIERAEASQGMPPKKREKYARREDAILHALELEKQLLEKKYGKLGLQSNGVNAKSVGGVGKEAKSPDLTWDNGKHAHASYKMDLSPEDKKKVIPLQPEMAEKGSQLGGDDECSDIRPRMRGLQDLGVSSVPSKHKLASLTASNGSHRFAPDDGFAPENTSSVNAKSLLEKRAHEGPVEESLSKRRDRRRPLVQVLESSAKLSLIRSSKLQTDARSGPPLVLAEDQREVLGPAKGGNSADKAVKSDDSFEYKETLPNQMEISTSKFEKRNHTYPAGLSEENNSESAEDTETDSSGTESLESDMDDVMTALSDEAGHIELIPKSFGRPQVRGGHESMSEEDADDLGLTDDTGDSLSTSVTVSKWQLKGKRNSRNSTKRFPNVSDRKVSSTSFKGDEGTYGYENADSFDKSYRNQTLGYNSSRDMNRNWEDLTWNDPPGFKGYWEDTAEYYDAVTHFGGRMKSMLIDVDLKVQSGYQREHVPMISLMSKLNGKAIVGHPIPIETLDNGSSEEILSAAAADGFQRKSSDHDTTLQPWRTARRTAKCRVPRPPHEDVAAAGGGGRKSRKGPPTPKPPAKRTGSASASQKTRTLSSIGTHHHHTDAKPHPHGGSQAEGRMKPESLPTAVACIPVKLVFSRLHEVLVARHQ